eukprot:c26880_g1_i3 orf=133-1743(+)
MDPRLLSSVSLDPCSIPYLVDPRFPSEGGLPQHLHRQEQHLGGGLTLRGPASVPAASLAPYSAVAPPVAGGSLSSGQGLYGVESFVGSGSNAVLQPWAASAESNRLLGGVAVPPGYKLVPVEQQEYERAPAAQLGYERVHAMQQGYERVPAAQLGYRQVYAPQQELERAPAVQQRYEGGSVLPQGYEMAPVAQQQRFEVNPREYVYPGANPLANAALIAPDQMVASPRLREMHLSPPRMPRLCPEPELSSVPLYRRPAYRLVGEQGGELKPMYGRTRQDLGQALDRNPPILDRPRPNQMPSFERSRKRARLSKNESTAAAGETKTVSSKRRSGWCSVCHVYCGPLHRLKEHKAGKKHKAQLNKKNDSRKTNKTSDNEVVKAHESTVDKTSVAAAVSAIDSSKKRKSKRDKAKVKELQEDIVSNGEQTANKDETKPNTYEKCEVCNITCANRAILQAHFAGKKHAAFIKKLLKRDGATKSNANQVSVVDVTNGVQTADGDVTTGEEEKTGIVSELLQETTEETETLVEVEEPREKEE